MAGKSPQDAADNFAGFIRETLSCISDDFLLVTQGSPKLYKIFYKAPADLDCHNDLLQFDVIQICSTMRDQKNGGYKVKTRHYSYTLVRLLDGPTAEEVMSYHWHPDETEVRGPHLHVGSVPRVHFPTSRVCLEDVIQMLMDYYGVRPIIALSECKKILDKNSQAFNKMATWK